MTPYVPREGDDSIPYVPFVESDAPKECFEARDRLAAVERFAQEPDLRLDRDYSDRDRGWREGHNAAVARLRMLLGIEEGT